MEEKTPSYITLAKTMLAALEEQETNIAQLQRNIAVQSEVNNAFDARIRRIEQELLSPKREESKNKKATMSSDEESLRDTFDHIFGPGIHATPEALMWILNRK